MLTKSRMCRICNMMQSGAGGFCLYIVPSLDMVIYKLGGATIQVLSLLHGCRTIMQNQLVGPTCTHLSTG